MRSNTFFQLAFIIAFLLGAMFTPSSAVLASSHQFPAPQTLSGYFSILWGDSQTGETTAAYTLTTDAGEVIPLSLPEDLTQSGNLLALNGKRVNVSGTQLSSTEFDVASLSESLTAETAAVTGSQPWVSILCKFSDQTAEPRNLAFFQGMYGSAAPGLDHYWREVSYDKINIIGSTAVGWYTLPQPRSYYVVNGALNLTRAATDCTRVADASLYFPAYQGINLMFNYELDGFAWGGTQYMTLDGVTKLWRMTWEPPWGYENISVIAHEMGHGFGLPHSSGNYGATYDNQWDVMSDTWTNCYNAKDPDPVYGCLPQHTVAYHKNTLGWISDAEKFTFTGSNATITLEQSALPQSANYKMAQIPIAGSATHFYTVEVRQKVGYDIHLPGQGVILHEVDTTRVAPAHVIDPDNNGNTGDAGAIWLPGETFNDVANGISVQVLAATATGYEIRIGAPVILPGAFVKTSPRNLAVKQPTSLSLTWNPSANASSYEVCYDTVNNNLCDTEWVSVPGTSLAVSGLLNNTTYYWQVRAVNEEAKTEANAGAWWNFKVVIAAPNSIAPGPVILSTPIPPEVLLTRRPTFSWEAVAGAASYTLEVSKVNTFATKVLVKTVTTTVYTHTLDLTANTVFYWRVKANAANGPSAYSQVRTFQTANPPSTPALISPANGALIKTPTILLDWKDSTVPSGTTFLYYEVQIASNSAFTTLVTPPLIVEGVTNSKVTTPVLPTGATYYWRVRAFNTGTDQQGYTADDQYSGWSATRNFKLAYAAPSLLSVANNPATFVWQTVDTPASYTLQVSTNNLFSVIILTKTIYAPATTYIDTKALTHGQTYYARIKANGIYGPSDWSATYTFVAP